MNLVLIARPAFDLVAQGAEFVFDRFLRQPLRGLVEVSEALALLLPDLTEATATAVVHAVSAELSTNGRLCVRLGFDRLGWGLRQLAWPIGLFVAVLVCQLPGGLWLLSVGALLLLTSLEPRAPTLRLVPMP